MGFLRKQQLIMVDVSTYMAFAAGLVSFLSPCVLPLVPGYISFISGASIEDVGSEGSEISFLSRKNFDIFLNSLFFVLGFSVVFIILGASASLMGSLVSSKMSLLSKLAGLVVIFFGVFKLGLIRSFAFYREIRFNVKDKKFGLLGAAIIGAAFAFGWTPCIGPILGSILAYASTLEKANQGMVLLSIYSLGLGLPFLMMGLGINWVLGFFDRIKRHLRLIEVVSGIILIILGILIFSNKLLLIPGYLSFLNRFAL
ncbi:MAG: cytochrome c biogenesis protein CcdA [Deltaproteobacteria bacterium]|nr:cytochrome c biogenesis protein CcdA [Deltaproteobacteria bacterium]MBW2066357.1 cytochrome c biogenesis protein CcdA [Deltaproteobacteria bacterium]